MKKLFVILFIFSISFAFGQDTLQYKIKEGETLYKLSKIYEISVKKLTEINKLSVSTVQPKQTIKVYKAPYLSENKIEYNTKRYYKDLKEKQIKDNNTFYKSKLEAFENQKKGLDIDKDIFKILAISKEKGLLKDSLESINTKLQSQIDSLDTAMLTLQSKIKIEEQKKESIQEVKVEDKTPKEIAKSDTSKAPELAKEETKSTSNDKTATANDNKKSIVNEQVVQKKENVEQSKEQLKKEKNVVHKPTNQNKLELDSLKKVKLKNEHYLQKEIDALNKRKSTLDINTALQEILSISKQKFLVTDSIQKINKNLSELIEQKESQFLVKKTKQNKKDNQVKPDVDVVVTTEKKEEVAKIKAIKKAKEKLDKKLKNEEIIKRNSKKSKDVAITKNIDEVTVKKSKKKVKYTLGDEVDYAKREKAKFFLSRAKIEIDKENIAKAKDYIEKSIKLNPSYKEAYVLKADIYSSFQYYDRAINTYKKALILDPKDSQLHYNMGNCFIQLDNDKKAQEEWSLAIQNDSSYILAYAGRASLYMKNKQYKKAIADYNKIFELNKYFYVAYKGRGTAYLENGDFGKAIIDFNQFLEYEPNDTYVFWKRGLAKLYDNNIYGGCLDLLTASEKGDKDAERALKKHCEK